MHEVMCQEVECQRPVVARGLCQKHYYRARRRGKIKAERAFGAGLDFLCNIPETDDCIVWPFGHFSNGYGSVKFNGRSRKAHRVSYELNIGEIPMRLDVCHNCGIRPCVNPRHLRADTRVSNMADKIKHGTHSRGSHNPNVRLTPDQVARIRQRVHNGEKQRAVALDFGVSQTQVSRIIVGLSWAHEAEKTEHD